MSSLRELASLSNLTADSHTEGAISESVLVKGAVAFGRAQAQIGLLVEPADGFEVDPTNQTALAKFRNAIWYGLSRSLPYQPSF